MAGSSWYHDTMSGEFEFDDSTIVGPDRAISDLNWFEKAILALHVLAAIQSGYHLLEELGVNSLLEWLM